jgi:hypothetical protein
LTVYRLDVVGREPVAILRVVLDHLDALHTARLRARHHSFSYQYNTALATSPLHALVQLLQSAWRNHLDALHLI